MKKEIQKKSRRLSAFLKVKKKGSAYYELIIKTLVHKIRPGRQAGPKHSYLQDHTVICTSATFTSESSTTLPSAFTREVISHFTYR